MLDKAINEKLSENYNNLLRQRIEIAKMNSWETRVKTLYKELVGILKG